MTQHGMTIVWDIDDVLLEWRQSFHDWMVAAGTASQLDCQSDPNYDLCGSFPDLGYAGFQNNVARFRRSAEFAGLPLVPGAEKAVALSRRLAGPGGRLVAVTAPGDDEHTRAVRLRQIARFGFDDARILALGASKTDQLRELQADLLIDDSPKVAQDATAAGFRVLLKDKSYNRHLDLPKILCWTTCLGVLEDQVAQIRLSHQGRSAA